MRRCISTLFLLLTATFAQADGWLHRESVRGSFDEIKEGLVMAVENRGLVINYTSHIADMLARTGADIGAGKQIFNKAEIVEFCSANLSRRMMELDPKNIVMCPFAISIYTLPGETDTVWLSYRKPQGQQAAMVGELLEGVIAEAAGR
jgi:uncharacterized protein (DUF302 family)